MKKGKFIVVSGPSGVGKGTICNVLIKELSAWYSVSMTTREKREGEEEGKNYYFVTKEEFENKIKEGNFIEYNIYNNNYYGTPKDKILEKIDEGIDVFLEIDVNGARNIKRQFPNSLLIYIAPPSNLAWLLENEEFITWPLLPFQNMDPPLPVAAVLLLNIELESVESWDPSYQSRAPPLIPA